MAKVNKYSGRDGSMTSVWNDSGDKRYGFVSKDRNFDTSLPTGGRYTTRYGVGLDNMGSPLRGNVDKEINTPLGTLDFGYEGDTSYAGFTPNVERTHDYYTGGDGTPRLFDYNTIYNNIGNDSMFRAGQYGNPSSPTYFASQFFPESNVKYIPDFDKTFNTPLGELQFESNYDVPNTIDANFTPNAKTNYYLQALANLLGR